MNDTLNINNNYNVHPFIRNFKIEFMDPELENLLSIANSVNLETICPFKEENIFTNHSSSPLPIEEIETEEFDSSEDEGAEENKTKEYDDDEEEEKEKEEENKEYKRIKRLSAEEVKKRKLLSSPSWIKSKGFNYTIREILSMVTDDFAEISTREFNERTRTLGFSLKDKDVARFLRRRDKNKKAANRRRDFLKTQVNAPINKFLIKKKEFFLN